MAADEVVPVGRLGRTALAQLIFGKAVFGEDADETRMTDEDGPGAKPAQLLGDADAVEGGAVACFGEQGDSFLCCHGFVFACLIAIRA
ncbi:hypothetical protein D3C87_1801660 [compost metagenome]